MVFYVCFSYYQTSTNIKNHNHTLLMREQKNITEAFHHLQQFLSLTESRLLNSLDKPDTISSILSGHIAHLMDKAFPKILSMAFTPASDSHTRYTRFGKSLLPVEDKTELSHPHIIHLGKGVFRDSKILYDDSKKAFGILHSTFSIAPLLYQNFSEDEIEIIYEREQDLSKERLFFKIPELPYIFSLTQGIPSFWQFLWSFKVQTLSTLLFILASFLMGVAKGISFHRRRLIRQTKLGKKLKRMYGTLEKENQSLDIQLIGLQDLVKLKERSKEGVHRLFNVVQERYQKMAIQAQAINTLISNLILEEAKNDTLLQKIHEISHESTLVLRHLVRGFPMKDDEETVDIMECIETIKTIFLPEIITRNSTFEIKGKIKKGFLVDKNILEIVLHNIFYMIVDRLNKNNLFKIVISENDALQLTFFDDGYDVEARKQNLRAPLEESILRLQKKELREFISHLGWQLSFQKKNKSLNVIKLLIPQENIGKPFTTNVVNFLKFKARSL